MNYFQIGRWLDESLNQPASHVDNVPTYMFDTGENNININGLIIVSPGADRLRVKTLITMGARQVLIGDMALTDVNLLQDMIEQYGSERIGIWLSVRLSESDWVLDSESNADFSFVSVTNPVPRWIVLKNNGDKTNIDALSWASKMLKTGCSSIMVSIDEPKDEDLLACAEMSEIAGNSFWLNSESSDIEELRFWIKYGHAKQLVVPHETDIELLMVNLDTRLIHGALV